MAGTGERCGRWEHNQSCWICCVFIPRDQITTDGLPRDQDFSTVHHSAAAQKFTYDFILNCMWCGNSCLSLKILHSSYWCSNVIKSALKNNLVVQKKNNEILTVTIGSSLSLQVSVIMWGYNSILWPNQVVIMKWSVTWWSTFGAKLREVGRRGEDPVTPPPPPTPLLLYIQYTEMI